MPFDIAESELKKTEDIIGALPEEYRMAMMEENGGEAETEEDHWEFYPIKDTSDSKRMSRTCNHIISETESCKGYGNFPEGVIAIANNGLGDQMLFIKHDRKFKDEVYLWLHETGKIQMLAESFNGINRL